MDHETPKTTDRLSIINTESSLIGKVFQSFASHESVMGKTLQSLASQHSVMDKAMAAMAKTLAIDTTLQSLASQHSVMDKAMAAMAKTLAIDTTFQSFTSQHSIMDKAMAAMTRSLAIDKTLQPFASQYSAMAMAAMASPSALERAFQSISDNQASSKHTFKDFAKANSVILAEPNHLFEISKFISRIDLDTLDLPSVDGELENTETEFTLIEKKANFISMFSNLPPFTQAIFFYFLIYIFLPQLNSISANLLSPKIESYLEANVKPDRQKIKQIKSIPLSLKDVVTDDLRFITGNNVHLRASPSTNSEVHDELVLGQVVTVLSKQKNWIEVMYSYEDGEAMFGWVFTRYTAKFIK